MALKMKITEVVTDPKVYFKEALTAAHMDAMKAVGLAWHSRMLPRHFIGGAGQFYGYKKRGLTYTKAKQMSGRPPLVYSGKLRAAALAQAEIKVSPKRLSVKMPNLPNYVSVGRVGDRDAAIQRLEKAIAAGKNVKQNRRALERIKNSKTAGRYPDILKHELITTNPQEVTKLLKVYEEEAQKSLKQNPRAMKKSRQLA